jgi:low temperature requirement protein LtrA
MTARAPHESHRVATPLELFFDLVFVVAIARAAAGLHHAIAADHAAAGVAGFVMVFFAIWWAWMNFTWFASAYDCDDVPYRLATFVQITGALIFASGVAGMFEDLRPNIATVGGYVVMRLALVAQWLRAARSDPAHRRTALRYAVGVSLVQAAWVAMMWWPAYWTPAFPALVALEVFVPAWAERAGQTTWHPHHIAERYALLTIIVLGESILAATIAIDAALLAGSHPTALASTIVGGLLIVFSMWWIYFDRPAHDLLTTMRRAFVWGYGHLVVFASAAAVGAGLAVTIDQISGHATIGSVGAGLSVTVPVVTFMLSLWVLHNRAAYRRTRWVAPVAAPLILATSFTGHATLATGLILAAIVAYKTTTGGPTSASAHPH